MDDSLKNEPIEIRTPNTLDITASGVVIGKLIKREEESLIGHAYDVVINQRLDIGAVETSIMKYIMRSTGRQATSMLFDPTTGMFEIYLKKVEATPRGN